MNDLTLLMIKNACDALQYAYAPYSNYLVAACICSEDGRLFTGVNVENSSYGLTICAERAAICKMVSEGQREIRSMVLMSGDNALCAPCGACRQCIYEFSTPKTHVHLCNQETILKTMTPDELLPMAFRLKGYTHD